VPGARCTGDPLDASAAFLRKRVEKAGRMWYDKRNSRGERLTDVQEAKMAEQVIFLGTCAHDFSEALTGECRDRFDRDARRASSLLIGRRLLVDPGPHVPDSLRIAGCRPEDIEHIFVTHLHSDHFDAGTVAEIARASGRTLTLWVRRDAVLDVPDGVQLRRMEAQVTYRITDSISVTSLDANHGPQVFPQWFLFDIERRKLLYALDGAWFLTHTYNYLKNSRLDFFVVDATCGNYTGDYRMAEHNSLPMLELMLPSLKTAGIVSEATQIYLSHIAPSLHRPHEEIERQVAHLGMRVAYDGLTLSLGEG